MRKTVKTSVSYMLYLGLMLSLGVVLIGQGAATENHSSNSSRLDSKGPLLDSFLKVDIPQAATAVCGRYLLPGAMASGYALHVFPDGVAMVERYSDISESRLIALGQWTFEDGVLKINWHQWDRFDEIDFAAFQKGRGFMESSILYTRSRGTTTSWFVLIPAGSRPTINNSYPVKIDEYVDWMGIKKKLQKVNSASQPKHSENHSKPARNEPTRQP